MQRANNISYSLHIVKIVLKEMPNLEEHRQTSKQKL